MPLWKSPLTISFAMLSAPLGLSGVSRMSLETRVESLESKHENLDAAVREMMKVIGGTHEVVTLILKEQLEMRKEQFEFKREVKAGFKELNSRFDQLELLIRQKVPLD